MYSVSAAILSCLCVGIAPSVRILWRRSAIFINTMRTSTTRVESIFLKLSACGLSFSKVASNLVNPSTITAILSPFCPKAARISGKVIVVSSTVSCSKAATIAVAPSPISSAQIRATSIGCNIYASPVLRRCSLWAATAIS